MRVIGVDPGSAVTGFGVVDGGHGRLEHVAAGTIRVRSVERGGPRLLSIYQGLLALIDQYAPDAMSLERSFAAANIQSAFKLGEARAVAILAAAEHALPLFQYAPAEVKLTVAGHGHADKATVKMMVRRALGDGVDAKLCDDATDALAIAMCHLSHARIACQAGASARNGVRAVPYGRGRQGLQ
jgi:crossover junction endodeoxyribonuclease RuvC